MKEIKDGDITILIPDHPDVAKRKSKKEKRK